MLVCEERMSKSSNLKSSLFLSQTQREAMTSQIKIILLSFISCYIKGKFIYSFILAIIISLLLFINSSYIIIAIGVGILIIYIPIQLELEEIRHYHIYELIFENLHFNKTHESCLQKIDTVKYKKKISIIKHLAKNGYSNSEKAEHTSTEKDFISNILNIFSVLNTNLDIVGILIENKQTRKLEIYNLRS